MSARWVAGCVRARLLLEHRAGPAAAVRLAGAASLGEALAGLAGTAYAPAVRRGDAGGGAAGGRSVHGLAAPRARRLAASRCSDGAPLARGVVRAREPRGPARRTSPEGASAPRSSSACSPRSGRPRRRRRARRASAACSRARAWGDPGSDDPEDIHLALRLAWARRVAAQAPEARAWAVGSGCDPARRGAVRRRPPAEIRSRAAHPSSERRGAARRPSPSCAALLPAHAAWALDGIEEPERPLARRARAGGASSRPRPR